MNVRQIIIAALFAIGMTGWSTAQAQISIGVVQDSRGSATGYEVMWGCGSTWSCNSQVKSSLNQQGYSRVKAQGNSNHGHSIEGGYYVVIQGGYTQSNGTTITTMGLGASQSSYRDAERNAVRNMDSNYWNWTADMSYHVLERSTF